MNGTQTGITIFCVVVSSLLLRNLWSKQGGSLPKKIAWSVILCIPFAGWIFYGGFYATPGNNDIKAGGKASGWANHWPTR